MRDVLWPFGHSSWFDHIHSPAFASNKDRYVHGLRAWHPKAGPPMYVYSPDVDLRETDNLFFLDVEAPGVSDKSTIKIHWASTPMLIIEGEIARPEIDQAAATASTVDQSGEAEDISKSSVYAKDQQRQHSPSLYPEVDGVRLTVCERKIGHFIRTFNLPVDVDRHGLKARLDAGLLQIQIPKLQQTDEKWKVEIE